MQRIGIDARLTYYSQAGIAQYIKHLIQALALVDPSNKYLLLQSRKDAHNLASASNQKRIACWTPSHNRFERWALGAEIVRLKLDLLHSPDFIPPRGNHFRSIITVHDLAFLRYPEFMTAHSRRYYNGQIKAATQRAEHIIAVSEATRADLLDMLATPPDKVTVIYEAADDRFQPQSADTTTEKLKSYNLTPGYILFVGTIEPRKNLHGLLRAYEVLQHELQNAPPLVFVGRRGWLDDDLMPLISQLTLDDRLHWLEDVDTADLPLLYSAAAMLCMPSHYEGFGLPVLEAMACGTPVVVANRSSLPEICGEAGLLVDPDNPTDIAAGMQRVLTDSEFAATLRQRGLARAKQFSWQKAARQTFDVYRQVLA